MNSTVPSILSLVLLTVNLMAIDSAEWPTDELVKVVMKDGAILRKAPTAKSKKLAVLKYGTKAKIIRQVPKSDTVAFTYSPMRGIWLEVNFEDTIGFLFSPTVERDKLNQYSCQQPQKNIKPLRLYLPGIEIDFCSDGTYLMDRNYICYGSCWEHGCWSIDAKKRVLLKKQKTSMTRGIGKPLHCTHACRYEIYTIESQGFSESATATPYTDLFQFIEYYNSMGQIFPAEMDGVWRTSKYSCRDSIH